MCYWFVEEIKDSWMIGIVGGIDVFLWFVEYKVMWVILLGQCIFVIFYFVFWLEFKRGIFYNVVVYGNVVVVNFMFGNSLVDVQLLSDKFIKLYEIFLVCYSVGVGKLFEKEEFYWLV